MTSRNRELASIIDDSGNITTGGNLSVTGNLTQTSSTTTTYSDGLLELNSGAGSNSNDLGLVMERGSTGNNAIFLWDESNDGFAVGTTTAVGSATGNISFSAAPFTASTVTGTVGTFSTSVKTPLIEYTDGDDAITIADGGHITTGGNVSIGGSNNELRFYEGSNYVGFEAPALSADKIWVLPAADGSANQILKTDGSGNLSFTDDLTLANASVNNYSGNGSATGFTLSTTPVSENATQAYINGVYQFKNTYSVSGTTFTFDTAPADGASIEVLVWSTVAVNVPADSSVSNTKLAASAITGQTEVTAADADHILIYDASATALKKALVSDLLQTNEEIADIVGAMVSSNTESGITVAYQDSDNTIDFTIGTLNQNTTGTAATVTGAAQTNITSLGTLTALSVDNITINGNDISTTNSNGHLTLTPNGTGNVQFKTDSAEIIGTEGEAGRLAIIADEADDYGDIWSFVSNTDNTLTINTDKSNSTVAQMTLTPHATVASSTTAIAGKLTVAGNLHLNGGTDARIQLNTSGAGATSTSNDTVHIRGDGDHLKLMSAANGGLYYEENGTERFTIASGGAADLGGTLVVGSHSNGPDEATLLVHSSTEIATGGNYNAFGNLHVTTDTRGINNGGTISMGSLGRTSGPTEYFRFAQISGRQETNTNGDPAGYMAFETTSGVTNLSTERMRIYSTGKIGIGSSPTNLHTDAAITITTPSGNQLNGQGIAFKRLDSNDDQQLGQVVFANNSTDDAAKIYAKTDGANTSTRIVIQSNTGSGLIDTIVARSNGYVDFTGAADLRVTFGTQGTAGNNDSNWVRGDGTSMGYNAASNKHYWEIGGTAAMQLDTNRILTLPVQPYFEVERSGHQNGFESSSSSNHGAVVIYNDEVTDLNGDMGTNGLFTAPVDGTYYFSAAAIGESGTGFTQNWFVINGSRAPRNDHSHASSRHSQSTTYIHLDANDTVGFHPYTAASNSVQIMDDINHTWMKGGLLH